ncbi:hypothetical protein ACFLV3_03835 [Chloroflexota bacterium]
MVTWKLKRCPRCGGDVFLDRDLDDTWHEKCLQCSYSHELRSIAKLKQQSPRREKEPSRR